MVFPSEARENREVPKPELFDFSLDQQTMLTVPFIRENVDRLRAGLQLRCVPAEEHDILDKVIALDDQRKAQQTALDQMLAERKRLSGEVGTLFKAGKQAEATAIREQVSQMKEQIAEQEHALKDTKAGLVDLLLNIPNMPHESVPPGNSDADNELVRDWPQPLPELGETAQPHWELAEKYGLFDLALGVKLTGAGFPVYRGKGARLQRALISYFLDRATAAGYEEILPPLMVNEDSARATGQLPDKEGQMYYVGMDDLYLIPTAEVPVTNIYRDVILKESDFPIKMTGHTPCFRREAGSYGAEVRGLNRVHQFDKVEIVQIQHPDRSYEALDEMVEHVAGLLTELELPFRIVRLCGGDLGFTSALTYDFEVYSAAQKRWLEVSSVSNFENYQSNRLMLRYKTDKGTVLAHTLNGSALALARVVAALLENNQDANGINIPKVLQPYTQFDRID